MSEPLLESFEKQPAENFPFAVEFGGRMPSGLTLVSCALSAINTATALTDNTVLASTTGTIVGTNAVARVKAGSNGSTYKITYLVTLSDDSVLEEDVLMDVKER